MCRYAEVRRLDCACAASAASSRAVSRQPVPRRLLDLLHSSVVEYERHRVLVHRRRPARDRRVVIVIIMPRFSRRCTWRLQRNCFVIPKPPTALSALYDGYKAFSVLLVEECIQDGIDAGVGRPQPLCERCDNWEHVFFPFLDWAS